MLKELRGEVSPRVCIHENSPRGFTSLAKHPRVSLCLHQIRDDRVMGASLEAPITYYSKAVTAWDHGPRWWASALECWRPKAFRVWNQIIVWLKEMEALRTIAA